MSEKIKLEVEGDLTERNSNIIIVVDTDHGTYEEEVESKVWFSEKAGRWYMQGHRGAISQEQAQVYIVQQAAGAVSEKFNPQLASSIKLEGEARNGRVTFHGEY